MGSSKLLYKAESRSTQGESNSHGIERIMNSYGLESACIILNQGPLVNERLLRKLIELVCGIFQLPYIVFYF